MVKLKRVLIFVHRWLGVVLSVLFLLWFPSGIGLMYWDFPSVQPADRQERSPQLRGDEIRFSPAEAAARAGVEPEARAVLNSFDGRPVYRFRSGRGRDVIETIVYADSGQEQIEVSKAMADRMASAWARQSIAAASVREVEEVDQWTVQSGIDGLRPLWKYSWPDGQQVYVSQASGEVEQYTTTASRWGAYVGAIPHWLYFTPLRKHGREWSRLVVWTSGVGTFSAVLGLVIAAWMYSPSKRYRRAGSPTGIPYRGQKRWHTIFGLLFGVGAATWAFSGMLSMDPFPLERPDRTAGGGRPVAAPSIPQALDGKAPRLAAFDAKDPRRALDELADVAVKQLELTSFAGNPIYIATMTGGKTSVVPVHGAPQASFDRQLIVDVVKQAAQPFGGAEVSVLHEYDRYYLDRRRQRPLPVVLAVLHDSEHTRYYIDLKTATVVGSYSRRNWMSRWLYHGLHSLDFPWLYNYRPLWDIVVVTFMVGGTALSVTSLVLAWRVLGRRVSRLGEDLAPPPPTGRLARLDGGAR
jgi:hypothetical protein